MPDAPADIGDQDRMLLELLHEGTAQSNDSSGNKEDVNRESHSLQNAFPERTANADGVYIYEPECWQMGMRRLEILEYWQRDQTEMPLWVSGDMGSADKPDLFSVGSIRQGVAK